MTMPLLQRVLQQYEWMGILIARLAVGILFALSGSGKLFVASRRDEMLRTVREAGIPAPELNAILSCRSSNSCVGILLVMGLLTPLCCLLLGGDMVVAVGTSVLPRIKASSPADWLAAVLYLPEVLYLVILVLVVGFRTRMVQR